MDGKFVSAVKYEHHHFEQPAMCIKSESQLACRAVLIQVFDLKSPRYGLHDVLRTDAVLERRLSDLHAAKKWSASRIISERDFPSR